MPEDSGGAKEYVGASYKDGAVQPLLGGALRHGCAQDGGVRVIEEAEDDSGGVLDGALGGAMGAELELQRRKSRS